MPYFVTNIAHYFSSIRSLRRITIFDMQWLEELRVPLRRQRNRTHERPRRGHRKRGPLSVALPPGPIDFLEYRKDLRAAHSHKRNYRRAMAQRDLDELIAAKLRQFVSIAIKQERAFDSLRKDANDLVAFEHIVCVFLASDDAAQLPVK